MPDTVPLLQMQKIDKTFPGVRALAGVDLTVRAGEIHALMGENGAGKSTLIKVLTGVYPRDAGTVLLEGRPVAPASPKEAERLGISTVYQEVNLIPHLSVAENILLGRQPKRFGCLQWGEIRRRAEEALGRLELNLDVSQDLSACSVAIQQMVAIARALDVDAKLLILDEPTSSLDDREVEELFGVLRRLRRQGLGILFVTHFLDQMYAVADCVTVLRNGERVGEYPTAELPRLALVGKMLGREPEEVRAMTAAGGQPEAAAGRTPMLSVRGLGRRGAVHPLDFDVAEGEVVGLAGLLGSGRTETARLLFGIDAADAGEVSVDGCPVSLKSPRKAIRQRFAFCSEDRKTEGLVPDLSVRENILLAMQARHGLRRLSRQEQDHVAGHYIRALDIRTPGPETPVASLSGGNQQKVMLARWLAMQPRLIILDEPTRGIDIGAKAEIEKLVASLREKGMAILFISSELEEIVRDCQRVLVLRDRRKVGELEGEAIDEHAIMGMIARSE